MEQSVPMPTTEQAAQVLQALKPLVSAYRNETPKETLLVYARYLGDIPPARLAPAVDYFITTSKWLPTVAEIREHVIAEVNEERRIQREAAKMRALEAPAKFVPPPKEWFEFLENWKNRRDF